MDGLEPEILWCDEALLVINKPAGLPTLPDGYNPSLPHVRSLLEPTYGRLWIVHRLDKETSGVLALARSAEAHRGLNTQFEQHQVTKVYHALVNGSPDWKEKIVNLPLRPNRGHRHRTAVDTQHGKPAVTRLRVLERLGDCTLIEAIPETGRTHQIRAHLAAIGLPILGDPLYGPATPGEARLALHARSLKLTHPTTGEKVRLEAQYPLRMEEILQEMRRVR